MNKIRSSQITKELEEHRKQNGKTSMEIKSAERKEIKGRKKREAVPRKKPKKFKNKAKTILKNKKLQSYFVHTEQHLVLKLYGELYYYLCLHNICRLQENSTYRRRDCGPLGRHFYWKSNCHQTFPIKKKNCLLCATCNKQARLFNKNIEVQTSDKSIQQFQIRSDYRNDKRDL